MKASPGTGHAMITAEAFLIGDTMTGGGGDDAFIFTAGDSGGERSSIDTILDFEMNGDDVLRFDSNPFSTYQVFIDTSNPAFANGAMVVVTDFNNPVYTVFLEGVDPTSITPDDIEFF